MATPFEHTVAIDRGRAAQAPALSYWGLGYLRGALVWAFFAVAAWYLHYRLGTFNPDAPVFSRVLFGAEVFGLFTAAMHVFICWRLTVRPAPPAPADGQSVDVFVTTINESTELVRRTLLAATAMDYPHETWLLDDGNRPAMRALAAEIGCRYLARTQNTDAKAGNLNHALAQAKGEFVAVFDADHAPSRDFLVKTLGYFADPRIAFVQTPQDFYNLDSFQHRRDRGRRIVWNEQSIFFRVIQRGKDYWNAAFFCGSCAVLRRDALDRVGGFATGTVTEDLHTSLKLHKQGYRSVYHAESLAFGLSPANIAPFVRQRVRWGRGALQVWWKEGIVFTRGLTLAQRVSYLATVATYFEGLQKGFFYFAPAFVLITGIMPIAALDLPFLLHFVPYYLLSFWVFEEVGRGYGRALLIEQYNMARFGAFLLATLGFWRRRTRFAVTPKDAGAAAAGGRVVLPQFLVLTFNVLAIPVGIALYALYRNLPDGALLANVFWAGLNTGLAGAVLGLVRQRARRRRQDYRFPIPLPARLRLSGGEPILGTIDDISSGGLRFYGRIPAGTAIGHGVAGDVFLPGEVLSFRGTVRSLIPGGDENTAYCKAVGCAFVWERAAEDRLDRFLYGSSLQWQVNRLQERARTPLSRLFAPRREAAAAAAAERWACALLRPAGAADSETAIGLVSIESEATEGRLLVTYAPLPADARAELTIIARSAPRRVVGAVTARERVETPLAPIFIHRLANDPAKETAP